MKWIAGFAFAWLAISPLRADWEFSARQPLDAPAGLEFFRCEARYGNQTAELHVVSFQPSAHTFAVMDNPEGAYDLGSAAAKRGALAAVNGGYFQPDRTPLGLVVRKGQTLHPQERSRLLSGMVVVTSERIALLRVGEFKSGAAVREALQAGPFLIDGGKPVAGLNSTRSAARTVVFATSRGRFGLLTAKSPTLAEMGQILAAPGLISGASITRALNLDGGTSTGLWVRQTPRPFYEREWKGVRNYLAILPR